ncbi:MAG TPA: methylated-DNA--[protein]-cysteine S-methyltransferase [bacterium]|nr:methylated-DNA--[protein]-cysteine S-methyltransferase [bacterium]
MPDVRCSRLATPVGPILVAESEDGLFAVQFEDGRRRRRIDPAWRPVDPAELETAAQLHEYFAGTRRAFDVRFAPQGTPFQQRVWDAVAAIPYGETRSYGAVAAAIGLPRAVRAVGAANGQNPWPIIVPCHRVIGGDGSLTGYGGGLPIKRALLEFERGIPWRGPAAELFADARS